MPQVSRVAKQFLPEVPEAAACASGSLDTAEASLYCPALYSIQVINKAMLEDPSKSSKRRALGSHYLPVNLHVTHFLQIQSGDTP